jgi:hypothetical protein
LKEWKIKNYNKEVLYNKIL